MKIFHLADIHASAKTLEQVKRCCDFVTEQAAIHQPGLIVIAGDIYDSRDIRLDSDTCRYVFQWVRQLSEYAPVFIVKGTPTHEGNAIKPLEHVGSRHRVMVADYPGCWGLIESVSHKYDFLKMEPGHNYSNYGPISVISAMPTPTKQFLQAGDDDLASALTPIFAGFGTQAAQYEVPHIHVGHYCVRGACISENQTMVGKDIEIGRDQIELANPDIVCLGHIHMHQEVESGMFYSGSLIRKNHGEVEDKGFYIYDLSMGKGNPKFINTPSDRLLRIREDFTTPNNGPENIDVAFYSYGPDELNGSILKIELTFWQDEGLEHTRESIEKFFEAHGCQSINVQIIRKPRENIRSQEILKAESLSEKVQLLADQNKEEITPGVQRKCEMLETMNQDECIEALNYALVGPQTIDVVEEAIDFVASELEVPADRLTGTKGQQQSLFEV
jgi:DNA repair exonuclease SbcCD nuclease subunit